MKRCKLEFMAEEARFELAIPFEIQSFQDCALDQLCDPSVIRINNKELRIQLPIELNYTVFWSQVECYNKLSSEDKCKLKN